MAALVSTTGRVGLIFRSSAASSISIETWHVQVRDDQIDLLRILLKQRQRLARLLACLGLIAAKKYQTLRQVETSKDRAARFVENVLEDPARADEIRAEGPDDYAERKGIRNNTSLVMAHIREAGLQVLLSLRCRSRPI
jgi:hypothetical protein